LNERLYRYLTLQQQVHVAYSLSISGHKWTPLLKALEVNFIKFRKVIALNPSLGKLISFSYKYNEIGSDLLFKALEDPTIQVEAVDAKIPRMDRNKPEGELDYNQNKQITGKVNH
jgi:hypothetical protein